MDNSELTISSLIARRRQLIDEIVSAVQNFEEDTGIPVTDIVMDTDVSVGVGGESYVHRLGGVQVNLKLPRGL